MHFLHTHAFVVPLWLKTNYYIRFSGFVKNPGYRLLATGCYRAISPIVHAGFRPIRFLKFP